MNKLALAVASATALSGCLATTPPLTSSGTPEVMDDGAREERALAWYCYDSSYDAEYEPRNVIFFAHQGSDGASVNIHGDDVAARFEMDGLNAIFDFGWTEAGGHYKYSLTIQPDGRTYYYDIARSPYTDDLISSFNTSYHCRKASK